MKKELFELYTDYLMNRQVVKLKLREEKLLVAELSRCEYWNMKKLVA